MANPDYMAAIGRGVKRKAGRPVTVMPSKSEVVRTYVKGGLSLRDAAAELGCGKDTLARALKAYGIKAHRRVRPSRLAVYGMAELRRRVKAEGVRPAARRLGVSGAGLLDYMRRHSVNK